MSDPAEPARLALTKVRIGREAATLYVYADRLVITTDADERTIPMPELHRVATRRWWRGTRLLLALEGGEILQVRRIDPSTCRVAHRTIIDIARGKR